MVGCASRFERRPVAMNRSACSVCDTQYSTVSRKLPIITAIATSIARLTDSAATEIDSRGTAPAMLAVASLVSTPPHRPSPGAQRVSRMSASGTRQTAPNTTSSAATNP
jgi:hypothetical protein